MTDLKIYTEDEKIKGRPRKPIYDDGQIIARKPLMTTRKSAPNNAVLKKDVKVDVEKITGKCDVSVKTKGGRKALADISNRRNYPLRNRLSIGSRVKKDKTEQNSLLQRVSVGLSVIDANASSKKAIVEKTEVEDPQMLKGFHALDSRSCETVSAENLKIFSVDKKIYGQSTFLDANHGKTASKPPKAAWKSITSQRISRGFSSSQSTTAVGKGTKERISFAMTSTKNSGKIIASKSRTSVDIGTRTKALVDIRNTSNRQLHGQFSYGSKRLLSSTSQKIKDTSTTHNGKLLSKPRLSSTSQKVKYTSTTHNGKSLSKPRLSSTSQKVKYTSTTHNGKLLSKPRLSSTSQKVKDTSTLSREPVKPFGKRIAKPISKVRTTSKSKPGLTLEKKSMHTSVNPSMKKEMETAIGPKCENTALVVSHECNIEKRASDGNECSSGNVTAVISKPRNRRRRSYTSLLVEGSKVLSQGANIVKQQELPNIDDANNHLDVAEYVDDIYQYYWIMEVKNPSLANYMAIQTDITPRMRGILINWLIEVHLKFDLMQETLFLMVDLLDRFLSMVAIRKDEMQLVGLTALLLASKYEDYWHPKVKDLISISDNIYARDQMLAMEKLILKKLMFRLNAPTPYVFMLRFLKAAQSDQKLEHLAFYLIELCLVEYEALKFNSSKLCASAIFVARCTLRMTPAWTGLLTKHTHYEESQLRSCAEMILRFQRAAGQGPLKVTYDKFLKSNHSCVALIKALDGLPQ